MKKIAIIEDDRSILEMYKLKFEFADFKVVTATDGRQGLVLLEKERPDLVLLDLMMPEMGGDEMLAELRKQPWGKNMPVIILTNVSQDEAPKDLADLQVSDFIVKANSTPQTVVDKVSVFLQKL